MKNMGHQKYTCPMHPQIVEEKPGSCPICGMNLVLVNTEHKDVHQQGSNPPMGQQGHNHIDMIADFKKRFYVVLVLTIPIMLLSEMIQCNLIAYVCLNIFNNKNLYEFGFD